MSRCRKCQRQAATGDELCARDRNMMYQLHKLIAGAGNYSGDEMVDILRRVLGAMTLSNARGSFDVLSALRGPDEENPTIARSLKFATTEVVRYQVLGYELCREIGVRANPDSSTAMELRVEFTRHAPNHFLTHARQAFEALGLPWGGKDQK